MNDYKQNLMDFSLNFTVPIYFGQDALSEPDPKILNGTGGLVKIEEKHFVLTCQHVLKGYREKLANKPNLLFQIGNLAIEPFKLLVDEDENLDMAIFELDDEKVRTFKNRKPTLTFFDQSNWPPSEIKVDDAIHFSGFPGVWKNRVAFNGFEFRSLSSGGSKVLSVLDSHFFSSISIEHCEVSGDFTNKIGGMSGAPVFKWNEDQILTAELVGMISEYQEVLDRIRIVKVHPIQKDGSIKRFIV
jgi:hypothetical protein